MIYLFISLILWSSIHHSRVSSCDPSQRCADNPEFSTTSLLVEMGGSGNVSCQLCRHNCLNSIDSGLEGPQGNITRNGTTIVWTVDKFTQSKTKLVCYYTVGFRKQCCASLTVVSYQPPRNLSLSSQTWPVLEGQRTPLRCDAIDVVFLGFLNLTVYRENVPVHQMTRRSDRRDHSNWTSQHFFNASKEDHGARYWCEAELSVEVEQDRHSRVFKSNVITAEVYYKPQLKGPRRSEVTLTAGDPLQLNCSAEGNPAPNYTWTHPSSPHPLSHDAVLTVESVTSGSEGEYVCSANNVAGEDTYRATVDVKRDYTYIIIAVVLSVAALAAISIGVICVRYYNQNRTGEYNLGNVFHLSRNKP